MSCLNDVPCPCYIHYTCSFTGLPHYSLLLKSIQTSLHLLLAFSTSSPILPIPLYILNIITSPRCSRVGGILPL